MSNFARDAEEVGSTFSDDPGTLAVKRAEQSHRHETLSGLASKAKASNSVFREEAALAEGRRQRQNFLSMNAYDKHKMLINEYFLYYSGATNEINRDSSRDKSDYDVVKNNHRFLWDNINVSELTWEQKLAKKYYEKLFHEYCICDLSRYNISFYVFGKKNPLAIFHDYISISRIFYSNYIFLGIKKIKLP